MVVRYRDTGIEFYKALLITNRKNISGMSLASCRYRDVHTGNVPAITICTSWTAVTLDLATSTELTGHRCSSWSYRLLINVHIEVGIRTHDEIERI